MASVFKKYLSGGVKAGEVGYYDTDGFFCAGVTALANGEDASMDNFDAIKSIDIQIPDRDIQTQTGDDDVQGSITFLPAEATTLGIQVGVMDTDNDMALQGLNTYDDTQFEMRLIAPRVEEYPLTCLITNSTAKKKVVGARGQKGYEVNVFMQGEIASNGADAISERALRNYDYTMALDPAYAYPWGQALAIANEGAKASAGVSFISDYKVSMHAVRGDDALTEVTLKHTPAGDDTLAKCFHVVAYDDSAGTYSLMTPTTDYTVNATTKVFTFDSALPAGDHVVIRYKYI